MNSGQPKLLLQFRWDVFRILESNGVRPLCFFIPSNPAEVGPDEFGPAEFGVAEISPDEFGLDEVSPAEVGSVEAKKVPSL